MNDLRSSNEQIRDSLLRQYRELTDLQMIEKRQKREQTKKRIQAKKKRYGL